MKTLLYSSIYKVCMYVLHVNVYFFLYMRKIKYFVNHTTTKVSYKTAYYYTTTTTTICCSLRSICLTRVDVIFTPRAVLPLASSPPCIQQEDETTFKCKPRNVSFVVHSYYTQTGSILSIFERTPKTLPHTQSFLKATNKIGKIYKRAYVARFPFYVRRIVARIVGIFFLYAYMRCGGAKK